jgi:hypothetical protein
MTQYDLDRAVAHSTGETIREIHRRGFTLADPLDVNFDPEPNDLPPTVIDWDALDLQRNVTVVL